MRAHALLISLAGSAVLLAGCASVPTNPHDICDIFREKRSWYRASQASARRWGGPIHVPMAIMFQESSFQNDAKPPMRWLLGFIPLGRASSAYGYSQAKKDTWADYQRDVGSRFRDRDNFADAIDFMFWYMNRTHRLNGVSKWDARNQYLNYHEGQGGYARGTYKNKPWLQGVAGKVDSRARRYSTQYSSCKKDLNRNWLMRLLF